MSYYASTVLPTMEDVFSDSEPPNEASVAATMIDMAGYPEVATVVRNMSPEAYETTVWDAHLQSIEYDRPICFIDDEEADNVECYEERYGNK